ncbi:Mov34/MPN/PAD-1 family protein [Serratia sp. JSRIV004]|uniref:Mov34/MPN/PAD-1 family protein n=1 Tax=Serratia sp. JSRIV004 TaxID=2831895 RepID=UPI001CBB7539|nr:Mov34/MPN/PAD-1 family protein [Serratia sp. JSRIV004]UAN60598.1 Mov34/MPN/PAD-1 family protein [Serratia sp. JSRIV004]
MIEYFELGERLDSSGRDSLYPQTISLLKACENHPYITVREIRFSEINDNRSEYLIIDAADGTVVSGNQARIRRKERLAIEVNPKSSIPILVHTLRKDFPVLSHQHAGEPNSPRILCLYEVSWNAVERSWTPERFLERIFWWLRESAELRLHREDQPLEQLFYLSPYQLILPANHLDYHHATDHTLSLQMVSKGRPIILRAVPEQDPSNVKPFRLLTIAVPPVDVSTVAKYPDNLEKLEEQLNEWGSELLKPLTDAVYEAIPSDGLRPTSGKGEGLLILLWIPRLRGGETERTDVMGYVVQSSFSELANALDILAPKNERGVQHRVRLLGGPISTQWRQLPLLPVEIRSTMKVTHARDISAVDSESATFQGILAGVGALGSTLADIWIRMGWGKWTFIDPDRLLPHNLARHIGFDCHIGFSKPHIIQHIAESIYPHEPLPQAINKSILDDDDDIARAVNEAHLVVDVSTTFEVPRSLALKDDIPRTVSLFLTPSGQSSVMLMEDADRQCRIDAIEGQYYRAILGSEWGNTHLQHNYGDRWVGGGCRDISVRMSNECIHVHAGILSRQLRKTILKNDARLCIWVSDENSGAVNAHEIELHPVVSVISGEWIVRYDQGLEQKLKQTRLQALPNETGGAIVGITDFKNKTIILVDVLPEPNDSKSTPASFVRGETGQQEALERVQQLTARVVDYVGEWHSHPQGFSAKASNEDDNLIKKLHQKMSVEGLPAVMLIVAENDINIVVR